MARRRTHVMVGAAAGMASGIRRCRRKPPDEQLLFVLGGSLGGAVGGMLPDQFEPATSSWHRGPAHSVVAGGGLAKLWECVDGWEQYCGAQYRRYQGLRLQTQDPLWRLFYLFAELFWGLLAGGGVGIIAGYLSHLGLDFLTPRSLPIIA